MNTSNIDEKVSRILLDKGILSFAFDPPYVFTTGLKSPIYIDNRLLISFPKELKFIIKEMINLIDSKKELKKISYISSSLNYAAPFGVLISEALSLPLVLVLEQHRAHGKRNKIEGHLPKGAHVLVVEDHISTGAALVDNANAVREAGGLVDYAVAVTDYELNLAKNTISNNQIKSFILAKGHTMVKEALNRKIISESQQNEILEWFRDPVKWGEDRGYYSNQD